MSGPFEALGAIGSFIASSIEATVSDYSGTDDTPAPVPDETEAPPDPTEAISDFVNALLDCIDVKITREGKEYQQNKDFERHANEAGL